MANRFTDTEKWNDAWFCNLNVEHKLFWTYLCDNCNHAGIWQVNWALVSFHIPNLVFKENDFKDRIVVISDEKWFIKKFVLFQQKINTINELNPNNKCHSSIISLLVKEGLLSPSEAPVKGLGRGYSNSNGNSTIQLNNINTIKEKNKKSFYKNPPTTEILEYFKNRHLTLTNKVYVSTNKIKDIEQLEELKELLGEEEVKQRLEMFFQSKKKFILENGYSIGIFYSQINFLTEKKEKNVRTMLN